MHRRCANSCFKNSSQNFNEMENFVNNKLDIVNLINNLLEIKTIKFLLFSKEQLTLLDGIKNCKIKDLEFKDYLFNRVMYNKSEYEKAISNLLLMEAEGVNSKLLRLIG
jgi:hypothetical protein